MTPSALGAENNFKNLKYIKYSDFHTATLIIVSTVLLRIRISDQCKN